MLNFVAIAVAACQITIGFGGPPCEGLQNAKKRTYGFRPTQLEKSERERKSKAMDEFWKLAKQQGAAGVKCLTTMLNDEKNDGFFLFDGAALLYSLDQSESSTAAVREAVLRSDLQEVDAAGYIRLVLNLSHHGADIGPLAARYLAGPNPDTFVPMHSLQLDRTEGGIMLFGTMASADVDKDLIPLLSSDKPEVWNAAAVILALNMTKESFNALQSPAFIQSLKPETRKQIAEFIHYVPVKQEDTPKFSREDVLRILRRIPHTKEEYDAILPEYTKYMEARESVRNRSKMDRKQLAAQMTRDIEEGEPFLGISGAKSFASSAVQTLREEDLEVLRDGRRKSIQGVSDEALYEYFAYTQIILGVINRLDLYKEYRSH